MRRLPMALAGLLLAAPAFAACPDEGEVARVAAGVLSGQLAEPYAPALTMADAECARDRLAAALAPRMGGIVGYKIGAAGEGVQRRYNLPGPVYGLIFGRTLETRSGATIELAQYRGIGVEADLLVRVRDAGIMRAGRDHVALLRHLDQVIPFIELPRNGVARVADGATLVSANVNALLGVVGTAMPVRATPEFARSLAEMTVTFEDNGQEIARAPGSALLGHPLNALAWLIEDLAKHGRALKPGDIVSLGGFAPSVPAQAGHTYTQRYRGLAAEPVALAISFR